MLLSRAPIRLFGFWLLTTIFLWGIAFPPFELFNVHDGGPEWFKAAQNACFGTLETGLPDMYGWMILILAPGSFLIALFIAWPTELTLGLKSVFKSTLSSSLAIVLTLLFGAQAYSSFTQIQKGLELKNFNFASDLSGDLPNNYPQTKKPTQDFELVDHAGRSFKFSQLKGRSFILTFAFAHCQTVCPTLVNQAKEALALVDKNANVALVIVTLDPWRDTPNSLPGLAQKWQLPENAFLLSGPVKKVEEVIKNYNIPYQRDQTNGDVSHPALTYVINAKGEITYTFNNAPPKWLAQAIGKQTHEVIGTASAKF